MCSAGPRLAALGGVCLQGPLPKCSACAQPVPTQLASAGSVWGLGRLWGKARRQEGQHSCPIAQHLSGSPSPIHSELSGRAGGGGAGGWHSPAVESLLVLCDLHQLPRKPQSPRCSPASMKLRCPRCVPIPWVHGAPSPHPVLRHPPAPPGSSQALADHPWLFPCPGASAPLPQGSAHSSAHWRTPSPSFRATPEGTIAHGQLVFRWHRYLQAASGPGAQHPSLSANQEAPSTGCGARATEAHGSGHLLM